ncbi:MAG TPA: hypothetical protein VFV50_00465 [Bdellovibrionales bacterium]|nr:hypothetical protein [Bdellovibrionales bacterium]
MKKLVLFALAAVLSIGAGLQTANACMPQPGSRKTTELKVNDRISYGTLVDQTGDPARHIQDVIFVSANVLLPEPVAVQIAASGGGGREIGVPPFALIQSEQSPYLFTVPANMTRTVRGASELALMLTYANGNVITLRLAVSRTRGMSNGCGNSYTVRK